MEVKLFRIILESTDKELIDRGYKYYLHPVNFKSKEDAEICEKKLQYIGMKTKGVIELK